MKKFYKKDLVNPQKKIKFGIIGCGRIFSKHYEIFLRKIIPNIELIAISDIKKTKLKQIKDSNLIKSENYKDLLKIKEINTIIILTESGNHYKIAKNALLSNKNIIVEKPLCLKIKEALELVQISKKHQKKIFVIMQNRFNNPIQIAKKYINKNKFGKIVSITSRVRWSRNQKYYNQAPWRGTWKYDGGALTNQGIHHIDLMYYLGGKVSETFAYSSKRLAKIKTEDTAVAVLKFKNGALGTLEVTTATRPRDLEGSISILGEKGTMIIGGFAANKIDFCDFKNKKDNVIKKVYFENPKNVYGFGHKKIYFEIVKNLRNQKNNAIQAEESIESLKILHSLYSSIENKKNITLNSNISKNKLNNA